MNENRDNIDSANILKFLMKVGDQKQLLKELVIANINNMNNEMSATITQIIATEFDKDEDIKRLLRLDECKLYDDSFNRISINCSLNRNSKKLKEFLRHQRRSNMNYPTVMLPTTSYSQWRMIVKL